MKKIKSLASILLSLGLLVGFSGTALAATPSTQDAQVSVAPAYISPDQPYPGFTGYCMVTAEPSLNVRSGPGTSYSITGSVLFGDTVNVVYVNSSGWAQIKNFDTGALGWVQAAYLDIL